MSQPQSDIFLRKLLLSRYMPEKIVSITNEWVAYSAADQKTQRIVQVQRLADAPAQELNKENLKRVSDTIGRLKKLPRVVMPVAAGIHAGIPFLVFSPVDKETLADRLRLGREMGLPQGTKRSFEIWLDSIAKTLDAAHQSRFFHGRLSPEAIVFLEGGKPALNGLVLGSVFHLLLGSWRANGKQGEAWGRLAPYAAPEVLDGQPPTALSDQYSLAKIVAEASGISGEEGLDLEAGTEPTSRALEAFPSLSKALSIEPDARHSSCTEFARAFSKDLGNASSTAGASPPVATIDEVAVLGSHGGVGPQVAEPLPAKDSALELATSPERKSRRNPRKEIETDGFDELDDLTFTQPGEDLLASKSLASQAVSVGAANASWRKAIFEFRNLSGSKQWIARAVAGVVALVLVYGVLTLAYRATVAAAAWLRSGVQATIAKVSPAADAIRDQAGDIPGKVKSLWENMDLDDEESLDEPVMNQPAIITSTRARGEPWPERDEDQLASEKLVEPLDLKTSLLAEKDQPPKPLPQGGLAGTFFVKAEDDDESVPGGIAWVGGFFAPPRPPRRLGRPVLDGNLMHELPDGTTFLATFERGEMREFWFTAGPEDARTTVYAKLESVSDTAILNGAAFVLNSSANECLALSFEHGDVVGGQWCRKLPPPDESPENTVLFEPPEDIVAPAKLEETDEAFAAAMNQLREAAAKVPELQTEANNQLRVIWNKAKQ